MVLMATQAPQHLSALKYWQMQTYLSLVDVQMQYTGGGYLPKTASLEP
jgi:hypothetical protein